MRLKIVTAIFTMFITPGIIFLWAPRAVAADPQIAPVSELENELTAIERELTDLEKEIDVLLEDLVDPKVTSLSVFFSAGNVRGRVPVSLQVQLDGALLATRELTQDDRLILVRGGAIKIHSGMAEPVAQNLAVECILSSSEPAGKVTSTGEAVFRFEPVRARENFIEITLSEDLSNKTSGLKLNARYWSKEL